MDCQELVGEDGKKAAEIIESENPHVTAFIVPSGSQIDFSFRCKLVWPELVGEDGKKAAEIIEKENPSVKAVVLDEDSDIPFDLRCDRVFVFVDSNNIVVDIPSVG
uniref:Uncharacterized protein n=1 Tax=Chenopodium quinoa TaxID=63459 RepID=A0A803LFF5_CHEQI